MIKIKKLALALNRLGLNKEAEQILLIKKIATMEITAATAKKEIRTNVSKLSTIFLKISKSLNEYLEYKKADPEDTMLSEEDLRGISKRIFDLLGKSLGLIELSEAFAGHISYNEKAELTIFFDSLRRDVDNLYGLVMRKVYGESNFGIKKLYLFHWRNAMEKLAIKCNDFINPKPGSKIEIPETRDRGSFKFDPSDEWTAVGEEATMPGSIAPEFQTSTEITLPTEP